MTWSWANIDWTTTGTVSAAWVQAIGSLGAIVWGVHLYRQSRMDHLNEVTARRTSIGRAAVASMTFAADQLRGLRILSTDIRTMTGQMSDVTFDRLAMADELLRAIPIIEADDGLATEWLVATRSRIAQATRRAREWNDNIAKAQKANLEPELEDLRRQLSVLVHKIDEDLRLMRDRYQQKRQ